MGLLVGVSAVGGVGGAGGIVGVGGAGVVCGGGRVSRKNEKLHLRAK